MKRIFDKTTGEYIDGRKAKFELKNTLVEVSNEFDTTTSTILILNKDNRKMSDKNFRNVKNYKHYNYKEIIQPNSL